LNSAGKRAAFALGAVALTLSPGLCRGEPVAAFYQGKIIEITVSSGEGGVNDSYARAIAQFIGKFIPGHPTVIAKNMPGAGGLKAAQYLFSIAAKDGTSYGVVQRDVIVQPVLHVSAATFDPSKFNWIGSTARETSVGVTWAASTPVKTIQEAMTEQVIVGTSGVTNETGSFPLILNRLIGTKFKPVHGYKSGTEIILAMERGEVQGRVGWSWGSVKSSRSAAWVKSGKIRLLVQMGTERAADLPDVPLALDLAKTPEDREAMELLFAATTIGWPSLMPPYIPRDRLAAVRAAYNDTMKDRGFIEAVEKQGLELDPLSGEQIQKSVERIMSFPGPVIERAQAAIKPE
jgi:tripartite-type tricarboxylate transporter receptor subunit TctC